MQPERFPPDDPRECLNRARSNLILCHRNLNGIYLEDLYFDAQQAAEKAIKAVLIARDVAFPYVHDLTRLLSLVEESGEPVPSTVAAAARLTRYAIETRYPGAADAVTAEDYERAVATAEAVMRWAEERVAERRNRPNA